MFVVDASVALAWGIVDEANAYTSDVLAHLHAETATAPAIFPIEVANAMLVAERRGRATALQATAFFNALDAAPIQITAAPQLVELGALSLLARTHRLTIYDALYLDLALRHGLPIATQDVRLRTAMAVAGVALFP